MYKIEKNIEMPEAVNRSKYPFPLMVVGDSFPFKKDILSKIQTASHNYATRNSVKFNIRKIDDENYRIWRVS